MQQPQADLGSFIRVWFLFLLRLYSAFVCYSVITSVFRWWRARPEIDFCRVFDTKMFGSYVEGHKKSDSGRAFDLKKIWSCFRP